MALLALLALAPHMVACPRFHQSRFPHAHSKCVAMDEMEIPINCATR